MDSVVSNRIYFRKCERGDLNPYGCPLDPKSSASANSATLACLIVRDFLFACQTFL